jgi:outer membrane protein TolC
MHMTRSAAVFVCLAVQAAAQAPPAPSGNAGAVPLPLSGRQAQAGAVTTTQITVNAGGANSVNLINSSVSVQGAYSGSVPAGTPARTPLPLTLDHALKLGLEYNLAEVQYGQAMRSARAQRLSVLSALLPNVNASLHETAEQISLQALGVRFPGLPTVVGPFNYFDLRASLTQSLVDVTRWKNLRSAADLERSVEFSAKDARDLIVLAVTGSYLQIIAVDGRVAAARAQLDTAKAIYQQAEDRSRNGLNAAIDVLRSQVQMQTQQQRLRSLEADYEHSKLNLARIIGLPLGQDFTIANEIPYRSLDGLTLESALDQAYRNRADLQSARAQVRAAEEAYQAAAAQRWPSLSFYTDYGAIGLNPAQAHGTFTAIGALNVPIFQGGRIRAEEEQAQAALQQRKAELEDLRGRIDFDVRTAFLDLKSAADQVSVAQSNVKLAGQTLQQARDRFGAGVADTVEVVQAQEAVTTANNDYISAVYTHNLAKASLARATGNAEQRIRQYLEVK